MSSFADALKGGKNTAVLLGNFAQQHPQAAQLQWQIDRASVGTIHSFCAALLREHALRLGIDSTFRVLEEREARVTEVAEPFGISLGPELSSSAEPVDGLPGVQILPLRCRDAEEQVGVRQRDAPAIQPNKYIEDSVQGLLVLAKVVHDGVL